MSFERVHRSRSQTSQTSSSTSQFAPRPFSVQQPKRPPTQADIENEAFQHNKFEAFGLQLKEKHGTITPVEQERLGVLQTKMDSFWAQRMERAKAQPNILEILIHNAQPAQTTEPKATTPSNAIQAKGDTERDRPESSVEQPLNKTGLPDALKAGVENLSGYSLNEEALRMPSETSVVQRDDLVPGENYEDLANGMQAEEKLDGPSDDKQQNLPGVQRQIAQTQNEQNRRNLWVRTPKSSITEPLWKRNAINSAEHSPSVIQRVTTRNQGVPPVSYKGMMVGGGGGGHPPVSKNQWTTNTVNGTTYKFWNDANGCLEFTNPPVGGGPALNAVADVNIDAGGGVMHVTGRSLKNTRYQHFLAANCLRAGIDANNFGNKIRPSDGGTSPPGLTWHHHEDQGRMQLIDRDVHAAFGHHGGFSIWGS